MAATLDGMVEGTGAVFEAKSMLPWAFSEEGAAEKHMAQLQHNMWVTALREAQLKSENEFGFCLERHESGFETWANLCILIKVGSTRKREQSFGNVSDGRSAEIKVESGALVLRPLLKPTRKPRYTLDELLSGMTKENVPQEVDWGPPRGNEAW
jgi:antitoxin component of MazEF toxin-antitoxin module